MARKTRLTPFAKLVIVIVVVGGLYYALLSSGALDDILPQKENIEQQEQGSVLLEQKLLNS